MVKIISDSTCDLSKELLEKYDVSILPLHILLGDKECEDGKNITQKFTTGPMSIRLHQRHLLRH